MADLLVNLLASLIFAILAFGAGWSTRKLKDWRNLAHIIRFIGDADCIKIVVPGTKATSFRVVHEGQSHEVTVPDNVLAMGMSEGQAMGEIISAIRKISPQKKILIVPAPHFDDDGLPFISIGGPSINTVSRRYSARFFPSFVIKYPEHFAKWPDSVSYNPHIENGSLTEDFGFVFHGTEGTTRFILIFGVWTFGTLIAARSFLALRRNSDFCQAMFRMSDVAMTVQANVDKFFISHYKILDTRTTKS